MIYVNTLSVLDDELVRRAVGADADIRGVLLTGQDDTVQRRLQARELGSTLAEHVEASRARDAVLTASAGSWVTRVPTHGRGVGAVAADVIAATGWLAGHGRSF